MVTWLIIGTVALLVILASAPLFNGRMPDDGEKRLLMANLQTQFDHFRAHPKEAAQLLAVGVKPNDPKIRIEELAAYAVVASLIFNLDEVSTKQ